MKLYDIDNIEIEDEVLQLGVILLNNGDTIYFSIIDKAEFDRRIAEERARERNIEDIDRR